MISDISFQSLLKFITPAIWLAGMVIVGILAGLIIHTLIWHPLARIFRKTKTSLDDSLKRRWRKPTRFTFMALFVYLLLPLISGQVSEKAIGLSSDILVTVLIISIAWSLIKLTYVVEEVILHHYEFEEKDNLRARQIHTQVKILKRLAGAIIVILAVAVIFMSYDRFRELGAGILASAGIAGLIIGFAAQKTLGNLLAGIQIAITQPIRLDDVVIVENEWGRIEEITLTYVVVRIWDLRRLVLPISYFIERPFQIWTRVSADILGTVFVYVDYTVPIDAIRKEFTKILENSEYWNKEVNVVQVTNASEKTIEVRALMSASDSSTAWNLRCEVREMLIEFLKENYPDSLPRARIEINKTPDDPDTSQ